MSDTPITDGKTHFADDATLDYIAQLENDRAALIEALEPFADSACFDKGVLDEHPIEDCTELTEAHLRKAHAVLSKLKGSV